MNALDFIISLKPSVPMGYNGEKPVEASNSQIRRWLQDKAIIINGVKPAPMDEVEFPVTQVVFFPKSETKRTTIW